LTFDRISEVPMPRLFLAALVVCAAAGCGGDDDYMPTPTSNTTNTGSFTTITIARQNGAQSFSPNPAQVGGQTVVFRNADTIAHRVLLNDGTIDTGNIAPGATSAPVTMPVEGTNYHCSLHPDMVGAVNPAGGGPPPECAGYC
jgi:plastocyanin